MITFKWCIKIFAKRTDTKINSKSTKTDRQKIKITVYLFWKYSTITSDTQYCRETGWIKEYLVRIAHQVVCVWLCTQNQNNLCCKIEKNCMITINTISKSATHNGTTRNRIDPKNDFDFIFYERYTNYS